MDMLTRSAHPGLLWASILAVAGLLAACTGAPPAHVSGYTTCDGDSAVVWIRPGIPSADSAWTAHHEASHVAQVRAMGCDAWQDAMDTPAGVLRMETEAYSADVRRAVALNGRTMEEGAALIVENLLETPEYVAIRSLGRARVELAVRRACGV